MAWLLAIDWGAELMGGIPERLACLFRISVASAMKIRDPHSHHKTSRLTPGRRAPSSHNSATPASVAAV